MAPAALTMCLLLALAAPACTGADKELQQHREKLDSIAASARLVGEYWLAGDVAPRYARTAWSQLFVQTETERQALGQTPHLLTSPTGVALSFSAARLAATLATLPGAVDRDDRRAMSAYLAMLDNPPPP